MPRLLRLVILAFAGCLIAAASSPQGSGEAQQRAVQKHIEHSLAMIGNAQTNAVSQARPGDSQRPCPPGQRDRTSDLCAQWEAASAARDSANWAFWTLILTIVGTLGLLATLFYTRSAVRIASEATKDADDALVIAMRNADAASGMMRISEQTQVAQLRAWILMDSIALDCHPNGTWDVAVVMKNFGPSPAREYTQRMAWQTTRVPGEFVDHILGEYPASDDRGVIPPNNPVRGPVIELSENRLMTEWLSIIFEADYIDGITDIRRKTSFRVVAKPVHIAGGFVMRWTVVGVEVAT